MFSSEGIYPILYQFLAICQGGDEGDLVGVFDVSAGRHAASDAGDFDFVGLELLFQVQSGQIAFGGGVGGEDDLLDTVAFDAMQELAYAQIAAVVVAPALEQASQDVIQPLVGAGAFDGDDVERLFDETERVGHAFRVAADVAELSLGDVEAASAAFQVVERFKAFGEALEFVFALFEKIEYDTLGHFRTDGGEGGEMRDKRLENFGVMHKIDRYE